MTRLHMLAGRLAPAIWLCIGFAAHAQPAQPGDAARAAGAMARDIAGTVLAPATALGGGPAGANPGIAPGSGPMVVPMPHAAGASSPFNAPAAPPAPVRAARVQDLALEAGTGRIVSLGGPAASVFAADPKVAEVRPASPTSLFVLGVAPGRTTISAVGDDGAAIAEYVVVVLPSSYAAAQATSAIARLLPGRGVRVSARPNGLLVSGTLATAGEADEALQTAREFVGTGQTVESRLAVRGSQQVNLRVRVAEVSRNVMRKLGVNWSTLGTIGNIAGLPALTLNANVDTVVCGVASATSIPLCKSGNFNGIIDALAQDNLAHVLAEPNLTAMSGETASFLVGGEFPIPVAQQGNEISIEFKQYGISLAFEPTVESGERISIKVRPEVSALTTQGAVQLAVGNSTIQVPALTVRRAETTVELASGQSFAIAGLLQDNTTLGGNGVPELGDVPVLGALFRDDSFQRNETELVIVITPYLVRGVSDPAQMKLPTDDWKPPNDLERILLLRQSARGGTQATATPHIPGDAGFVVQ
jgi:pilus assembly protein CpaC